MPENRISGYRIYLADLPISSPVAKKLYDHLISADAEFCLNKVNGSITLHYSNGSLSKLHATKVI